MRNRDAEDEGSDDGVGESDEADESLDADSELQTEAEISCLYCGESYSITLDPGGGTTQEYVEDCQVCCRPFQVHVTYDETGAAEVWLEESG